MSETKTFEEMFLSSNEEERLKISKIRILIVGNIKSNFMFVEKLKEWQLQNLEYFDYIFFVGNFLNLKQGTQNNSEIIPKSEAEITGLITFLENINLNMYYIGGCTDPVSLFKPNAPVLTMKSTNLHKKYLKLSNDLYVFGMGGSIPTFINKYNENCFLKPFKNYSFDYEYKSGFPFNDINSKYYGSDKLYINEFKQAFSELEKEIKKNNTTKNIKYILISNLGPFSSPTTYFNLASSNAMIFNGSKKLERELNMNDNIILNIHGNNNCGKGFSYVGNKCIINPGNLYDGEFVILNLERDKITQEWKVKNVNFKKLV